MATKNTPDIGTLQSAQDVKTAIIAYMLDKDTDSLHAGPEGAVKVLLDPNGFDLSVEKGRSGMTIYLVDKDGEDDAPAVRPRIETYRPPTSTLPGFDSVDA